MDGFWRDAGERALWTFVQAALAVVVAGNVVDIGVWKAGAVAGVAAVLSFVKSVAKDRLGDDTPGKHVAE